MPRVGNRRRLQLAFIANDQARKQTYKKRQKGLLKKMDELAVLCGVEACAVIKSPYEPKHVAWPSPEGAGQLIHKFRNIPDFQRWPRMDDQMSFLVERFMKASGQLQRLRHNNKELGTQILMFDIVKNGGTLPGDLMGLENLGRIVHRHLKDVERRLKFLESGGEATVRGVPEGSNGDIMQIEQVVPVACNSMNLIPRENLINSSVQENLMNIHPQEYILNPRTQGNVMNQLLQKAMIDLPSRENLMSLQPPENSSFAGMICYLPFNHNNGGSRHSQHSH